MKLPFILGAVGLVAAAAFGARQMNLLGMEPAEQNRAIFGDQPATGQAGAPSLAQVPSPPATPSPAVPGTGAAAPAQAVDETALRYFARQGDAKRLAAEIARLRALYPQWTPPADPLAVPLHQDTLLEQMWKLYSEGKIAEVRKAISDRQAADPNWQVPADLLDRLAMAEAREQIVNASDLKQYETVIRVGSANPGLLTCGDVDILWRVAEAFVGTGRQDRGRDAYLYVLKNCPNPQERLATVQKALPLLSRPGLDALLATEKTGPDGKGEFAAVRDEMARQSLAKADADAKLVIPEADVRRVEALARAGNLASDALLLGWYYVRRDNPRQAEDWFRKARGIENSATASQGLALALIDQDRPAEAEDILYGWHRESDDAHAVYMAAVANLLAIVPPVAIEPAVLQRMAPEVASVHNVNAAQQFGWYADALNQFQTAAQWFTTALSWKPDDEPSAYGLTLMRWKLADLAGVAEMQKLWEGRSVRIARVGLPEERAAARPRQAAGDAPETVQALPQSTAPSSAQPQFPARQAPPDQASAAKQPRLQPQGSSTAALSAPRPATGATPPATAGADIYPPVEGYVPRQGDSAGYAPSQILPAAPQPPVRAEAYPPATNAPRQEMAAMPAPRVAPGDATEADYQPRRRDEAVAARPSRPAPRGCTSTIDPETLAPAVALTRGWCLMEMNRPLEAAEAFEVGLRSGSAQARSDAAYGQSLAYLRAGLGDKAAVAASKSGQDRERRLELRSAILSAQATGAFEAKRYAETIIALDERAQIAPERTDLMVLRGYAYMGLRRYGDAERIFRAVALTGDREGMRGLGAVKAARDN